MKYLSEDILCSGPLHRLDMASYFNDLRGNNFPKKPAIWQVSINLVLLNAKYILLTFAT